MRFVDKYKPKYKQKSKRSNSKLIDKRFFIPWLVFFRISNYHIVFAINQSIKIVKWNQFEILIHNFGVLGFWGLRALTPYSDLPMIFDLTSNM